MNDGGVGGSKPQNDYPDFGGSKWPEMNVQKSAHVIHGKIREDKDPRFKGAPFIRDPKQPYRDVPHNRESQDHSYIENDMTASRNPLTGEWQKRPEHRGETSAQFVERENRTIPVMNSLGSFRQRLPGDREYGGHISKPAWA